MTGVKSEYQLKYIDSSLDSDDQYLLTQFAPESEYGQGLCF